MTPHPLSPHQSLSEMLENEAKTQDQKSPAQEVGGSLAWCFNGERRGARSRLTMHVLGEDEQARG